LGGKNPERRTAEFSRDSVESVKFRAESALFPSGTVIPGRREASNPESRDSQARNCAP
jgi:hypothetical protein